MQIYQVPYNFEHEEKIFGGYVSLRQAVYLIITVCSIALLFVPIFDFSIRITLFLTIASVCSVLAFVKIDGTNADKYLIYVLKYISKRKIYVIER